MQVYSTAGKEAESKYDEKLIIQAIDSAADVVACSVMLLMMSMYHAELSIAFVTSPLVPVCWDAFCLHAAV